MATYINKDDYFAFAGIDLSLELRKSNTDNPTYAVDIFMNRIEDWMLNHVKINYIYKDEDFDAAAFKKACLHQIDYVRRNGELSIDAANTMTLLAPNAKNELKLAGMANTTQKREGRTWPWI
jgi:hypothetical protein